MNRYKIIAILLTALTLVGCGAQKKAVKNTQPSVVAEPEVPMWHTCLIQGAQLTLTSGEERYSGVANMQVVRDSMCIISVTALLGLEVLRIEATPQGILGIDKIHGRYARATFDDINRRATPQMTWEVLQQLCSAELPTGEKTARLRYSLGEEQAELFIAYPERQTDVPVRMNAARLDKYTQIDIRKLL